jgi:hypothetical protein
VRKILIGFAIFLIEVALAVTLCIAPLLRDISKNKATGIGFVVSPQNIAKVAIALLILIAFAAWISDRIDVWMHRHN